ncbi:hypothetical protein GJ744_011876 [Endocarpon pusillum]|uniref:Uncharacterized protein n=1 Tax=Endocarpon pusillum TaxID=364733 RepID=A0A8H7ACF7_9EURO|nr:hypothetical protein GJ744_011876 [Endocarpon pusillum]
MDSTYFSALLVASRHHSVYSEEDGCDIGVATSWYVREDLELLLENCVPPKSVLNILLKRQGEDTDGGDAGQSRIADGEREHQNREAFSGVEVDTDWKR